jgi:hypothetical protein
MDREKDIDNILKSIKTQKQWDNEKKEYSDLLYEKYKEHLEDYIVVKNKKEYNMLKLGGYIRYINNMDEFKWGGILLKKIKINDIDYMILGNSNMDRYKISYHMNTIFYKKHMTASDKTRKLFISYMDKYEE